MRTSNNSNTNRNESRFIKSLRELLLPEIVSLIVAWILAIFTHSLILKGITVFLQFILVIFLPILVWNLLARIRINLNYIFKTLICVLITFAVAALFSTLTYAQPLKTPDHGQIVNDTLYTGKYLRGSSDCRNKRSPCLTKVKIEGEQLYLVSKPLQKYELHTIFDINWSKWEKFPTLPRNYRGRASYIIPFVCNNSSRDNPSIAEIGEPIRSKYSIAPKSIVLSYLVGFVEIPFLFFDDTIPRNIAKITREQGSICSLKE